MAFCGECGLGLKCVQKRDSDYRYYGRIERKLHHDETKRCNLPYVRADKLESAVWTRIKDVLSDREKLGDCINKALEDLEAQKTRVGADALALNAKLDAIRARKERLGIAFADRTVNESLYREMLTTLKKQETNLLNKRRDIDLSRLDNLAALEARVKAIK